MNGFSLMELVVAMAVTALVLLMASSAIYNLYQEQKRADLLLSLEELRLSFQQAVLDQNSWKQTANGDSMMSCFSGVTPQSCLHLNGLARRDLKVYSGSQILFDSVSSHTGYTQNGMPCSTFSAGAGAVAGAASNSCVLKPHLTWTARCNLTADPSCKSPLISVNLTYQTSSPELSTVNLDSLSFEISKATFGIQSPPSCSGLIPSCTVSQSAICEAGLWQCEEFGL